MSGMIIDVKANSGQANKDIEKLNKSLEQIQKTTTNMSSSLSRLAVGFGTVFSAALTVGYIKNVTDSFTQMSNKIGQVTKGTNDLIYAQSQLQKISQRTLATNEASINIFNKLGISLEKSNASTEDMLTATEAIQKAIALSNTSAEAANAAIVQLGQGLASGTLRGEELNSVLEQTPRVAKAIADGLGLGVGQLRALAAQGGLTSDAVFGSLLSQAEKLNKEFSKLTPTFSQSFGSLKSSAKLFTSEFLKGVGGGVTLAALITNISNSLVDASETIQSTMAVFMSQVREGYRLTSGLAKAVFSVFGALGAQLVKALPSLEKMRTITGDLISVFAAIVAPISKIFNTVFAIISRTFKDVFSYDSDVEKALTAIARIDFSFTAKTIVEYQIAFRNLAKAITENSSTLGARLTKFFNNTVFSLKSVIKYFDIFSGASFTFKIGELSPFITTITNILRGLTGIKVGLFDLRTQFSDTFGSAWSPLINLFNDVFELAKDKLAKTVNVVKDFAKSIILFFFTIYDEVIAHSWWTDTMDDVVSQAESLPDRIKGALKKFRNYVKEAFIGFELSLGIKSIEGLDKSQGILGDLASKLSSDFLKRDFKFDFDFNTSSFEKALHHFDYLITSLTVIALTGLDKVLQIISSFATKVKDYFFDIYDEVVGHSYWPDTVDGVISHAKRLKDAFSFVNDFKNSVLKAFKAIQDGPALKKLFELKDKLGKTDGVQKLASIGNPFQKDFDFSTMLDSIKTEFPNVLKTALLAVGAVAVSLLFPVGAIKTGLLAAIVGGLITTGSLAAERFGENLFGDSFLTQASYAIGQAVGFLTASFIKSIPQIINAILGIANGFIQGFLAEMPGIIGDIAKGLFGITGLLGLSGPLGVVGTILLGAAGFSLLKNIDGVAKLTGKLTTSFGALSGFVAGKGGILSKFIFGTIGPQRFIALIGAVASGLGVFDSIFAGSELAKLAVNGGILYIALLGKNGTTAITNGIKTVIANISTLSKIKLANSVFGGSATGGFIYTLLFGNESQRGALKAGIEKYIADKFNFAVDMAAKLSTRIVSRGVDILSTLFLGTNPSSTKAAFAYRFEVIKTAIMSNVSKLTAFLRKSSILDTIFNDIGSVVKKPKSIFKNKDTFVGPMLPEAFPQRPPGVAAIDNTFNKLNATATAIGGRTGLFGKLLGGSFVGPMQPSVFKDAADSAFNSINSTATKLGGKEGIIGKLLFGKAGKIALLLALLTLFTTVATASETANSSLAFTTSKTNGLFDSLKRFSIDNPLVTFATIAVTSIGLIAGALALLGKSSFFANIKTAGSDFVRLSREGGLAGRRRAAYGSVAATAVGAGVGAYIERDTSSTQGAIAGGLAVSAITGIFPAIGQAFAALGTALLGWITAALITPIAAVLGTGLAVAGGVLAGVVAVIVGTVASLWYWIAKGISPLEQLRNGVRFFAEKFKLTDEFAKTTAFDSRNEKLGKVNDTEFTVDTSKIAVKSLSDNDQKNMNKYFDQLDELKKRAEESVLLREDGQIDPEIIVEVDKIRAKATKAAERIAAKVRVSIMDSAKRIIDNSSNIDPTNLGRASKAQMAAAQRVANLQFFWDNKVDEIKEFLGFQTKFESDFSKKVREETRATSKKYNAYFVEALPELFKASAALALIDFNKPIPGVAKGTKVYENNKESAFGSATPRDATVEDLQTSIALTNKLTDSYLRMKVATSRYLATDAKFIAIKSALKLSADETERLSNAFSSLQRKEISIANFNTTLNKLAVNAKEAGLEIENNVLFSRKEVDFNNIQGMIGKLKELNATFEENDTLAERTQKVIDKKSLEAAIKVQERMKDATVEFADRAMEGAEKLDIPFDKKLFAGLPEAIQESITSKIALALQLGSQQVGEDVKKGNLRDNNVKALVKEIKEKVSVQGFGLENITKGIDPYSTGEKLTVAKLSKRQKLLLDKGNLEETRKNASTKEEGIIAHNQIIDIDKQLEAPKTPEIIIKSLETFFNNLSAIGADFKQSEFFDLPSNIRQALSKRAAQSAAIVEAQSKSGSQNKSFSKLKEDAKILADNAKFSEDAKAKYQKVSLSDTISKSGISGDSFSIIGKAALSDIKAAATMQEAIDRQMSDTSINWTTDALSKLKEDMTARRKFTQAITDSLATANDKFELVNSELNLNLSETNWQSYGAAAKSTLVATAIKTRDLKLEWKEGVIQYEEYAERLKAATDTAKEIVSNNSTSSGNLITQLTEMGASLNKLQLNAASPAQRDFFDLQATLFDTQKDIRDSASSTPEMKYQAEQIIEQIIADLQAEVGNVKLTSFDKVNSFASIEKGTFNILSETIQESLISAASKLDNLRMELARTDLDKAAIAQIQREFDNLRETLVKQVEKVAKKPQDTKAYQAGSAFASSFSDSVGSGLKSFLTGKSTLKETVYGVIETFANTVINTVVEGFTNALSGENGVLDNFLKSLGIDLFGLGEVLSGKGKSKDTENALIFSNGLLKAAIDANTLALLNKAPISDILSSFAPSLKPDFTTGDFTGNVSNASKIPGTGVDMFTEAVTDPIVNAVTSSSIDQVTANQGFFSNLGGLFSKGIDSLSGFLQSAFDGISSIFSGGSGGGGGFDLGGITSSIGSFFEDFDFSAITSFFGFANGGAIKGAGSGTSDSIMAMLSNGEYVINAKQTAKYKPLLEAINSGQMPKFAMGGAVDGTVMQMGYNAVGKAVAMRDTETKKLNTQKSVFNISVTGDISRQTRNEIQMMIPQITSGVNSTNRENGHR